MAGWTKLFSSIVTSSIWCEDDKTVRVWTGFLALADKDGVVEGSIPGLANVMRVSDEDFRAILAKLMAPDLDSRSKANDGRRLEEIPGGWRILNHAAYRKKADPGEGSRAPYYREYRARKRAEAARRPEKSLAGSGGVPGGLAGDACGVCGEPAEVAVGGSRFCGNHAPGVADEDDEGVF